MHAPHDAISPTAKLVAHWRRFFEVPFARDVARLVHTEEATRRILGDAGVSDEAMRWLAPMIEARYESLTRAIRRKGTSQVLELAGGLALRGLAMTRGSSLVYVETDLPAMHEEKVRLVDAILAERDEARPPVLHFIAADALDAAALEQAVSPLSPAAPLTIVHEGLLPYLDMDEKRQLARNLGALLDRAGGAWTTPDLSTRRDLEEGWRANEELRHMSKAVQDLTGRSFADNAFEDDVDLHRFFGDLGFSVEVRPQIERGDVLDSARSLGTPGDVLARLRDTLRLFTLKRQGAA